MGAARTTGDKSASTTATRWLLDKPGLRARTPHSLFFEDAVRRAAAHPRSAM